ncbi:MAG TPA: hypothetical protein GXZ30_03065 [Propionibacterium sp.]|nr:hypothetical protein [Propionibacterium sp.]
MATYATHGITDFVVCAGYKASVIKDWFASYSTRYADITFDLATGEQIIHKRSTLPWKVTVVDTGPETMTGGRLKRVRSVAGPRAGSLALCGFSALHS